ncbi:nucleotide-sugar transporter [Fomitiporia mediterranea MF3/22]|uniref:nucleotide-sugar transporter n=1 Tax=Fomitiporia mediterranea (strain MF3/22) TaxID=694068 RepID=UPI0004408AFC|nr:nucleotide-sugar transporter [Fomitiporia mediterranea MF3/22]EJD02186.1 nucleotide-sugar transporter [Fomitiporia mediterranea MF3/22]
MICGVPLKYVSLFTLAIQNAALSIVMHYSRVSMPASKSYSPAAAVLLNELLKGAISFLVAYTRTPSAPSIGFTSRRPARGLERSSCWMRLNRLSSEIFAPDCWKLSIPAILYVIQNSLQFVAISNLPVASFQVAYQMKIMTTAAFSVALLGKRLNKTKWMALLLLAVGVGIVQIQTAAGNRPTKVEEAVGSAAAAAPKHIHVMFPLKGFLAVIAACFTSGLAGVYFEMVLKNSKADLWVRNVQLSLFSLVPALLPIVFSSAPNGSGPSHGFFVDMFKNFGAWAWATVAIQVSGGLITAVVIKYSDNIMKGFATSLSIILSFLASVALFDYHITSAFLFGASIVLAATWMYNQPSPREVGANTAGVMVTLGSEKDSGHVIMSPLGRNDPILGEKPTMRHSGSGLGSGLSSLTGSSQSLSSLLGLSAVGEKERLAREREEEFALLTSASRTSSHSQFSVNSSPYISRSPGPENASAHATEPATLHPASFGQRRL